MITEGKLVIFWLFALLAAALIDPVKHNVKIKKSDLNVGAKEMKLMEEMDSLTRRLDSIEKKVMADSCEQFNHPKI
jgi:hypothetical protein